MSVRLIAHTQLVSRLIEEKMEVDVDSESVEDLLEFAGRTCYLSYDKPNPLTRSNEDYLENILAQQHESVLEHASASFYVEGVSRNMLLELERHRFLSFSVVSTRYVDARKLNHVIPPALGGGLTPLTDEDLEDYDEAMKFLRDRGKSVKQAREAAAFYLPGGLETRFVVTGNFRAWRDVLRKRLSPGANAEIREFAGEVLTSLRGIAPNAFQDLEGL
jgi:thymidylate synthase (FAD)